MELWIDIPLPPDLQKLFDDYEEISLLFFVVEYILRFWVISDFIDDFREGLLNTGNHIKAFFIALEPKLKWMVKPYSIIDLLAILPIFRV